MVCHEEVQAPAPRQALARARIGEARACLHACSLCEHRCGVDRSIVAAGLCHAGPDARFFLAQTEVADELELLPTFAIALSGCDLRCSFCITGAESWNPRAGRTLDIQELAGRAAHAMATGANTIMILGGEPTIHLASVLELVSVLPPEARLVWKTNAHGSRIARELLDGIFDVWLADYKFGNDTCAERLAKVPHYSTSVRENLRWAAEHSELIIRHLLMPGHLHCCWEPIAHWIADELPMAKVSLRATFWPAWQSRRHSELSTTNLRSETDAAFDVAHNLQLNLIP